jgi:hypothetical protein
VIDPPTAGRLTARVSAQDSGGSIGVSVLRDATGRREGRQTIEGGRRPRVSHINPQQERHRRWERRGSAARGRRDRKVVSMMEAGECAQQAVTHGSEVEGGKTGGGMLGS